jgi:putative serine protease PepD
VTPPLRHLWSGNWRSESETAREAAAERRAAEARARARAAEEAERRRQAKAASARPRRSRRLAAVGVAALALAGAAFATGSLIDQNDGAKPLPAVSDQALKPRKGQTRAGAIYAAASPAVVSIRTGSGSGTGFLIDRKGRIVTNAHVVGSSDRVIVRFGPDGDSLDGEVRGVDPSSDLAVVTIDAGSVPSGVKPLEFADSSKVRVGDTAIAIGNPFDLDRTATEGIVSGIGREIQAPNGFSIDAVIQTDAPINPGNSGGPLLDESAHVIGVNSQIATSGASQGNLGIGFAVPSNTVRQVVPTLSRGQNIERPYLGLSSASPSPGAPAGAEVQSVVSGGPADDAGVKNGDVITSIDGKQVREPSDVSQAISGKKPGDTVDVVVERGGSTLTLKIELGTRPAKTP